MQKRKLCNLTMPQATIDALSVQATLRHTNRSRLVEEIVNDALNVSGVMHILCEAIYVMLPKCLECGGLATHYGYSENLHFILHLCERHIGRVQEFYTISNMQPIVALFEAYAPELLISNPFAEEKGGHYNG